MMRKKWLYGLIILQVVILMTIAASHYMTLKMGEQVILKTAPIDPRDLFHGDYVTLNYDISTLSFSMIQDKDIEERETVYVVLRESDGIHEAVSVHSKTPDVENDETVLKGKVRWIDDYSNTLTIDYGIERYYIEENTGKSLEDQQPEKIVIRVAPWGNVTIEELLSNDG